MRPLKTVLWLVPSFPGLLVILPTIILITFRDLSFDTQNVVSNFLFTRVNILPMATGTAAVMLVRSAMSLPFVLTLPSACTLMRRGITTVGVVVSCGIALAALPAGGPVFATTMFAFSILGFGAPALGMWLVRPIGSLPGRVQFPAVLAVILVFAAIYGAVVSGFDDAIQNVTTAHPIGTALVALLCSAAMIVRGMWPVSTARGTLAVARAWWVPVEINAHESPKTARTRDRPSLVWKATLANGRTFVWLRAAWYEAIGGLRWGILAIPLMMAALAALNTIAVSTTAADTDLFPSALSVAVLSHGLYLSVAFHIQAPLLGGFCYPIARARRADVEFWSSVAQLVLACALIAGLWTLLHWFIALTAPVLLLPVSAIFSKLVLPAGIVIGLAPLAQLFLIRLRGVGSPGRPGAAGFLDMLITLTPVAGALAFVHWGSGIGQTSSEVIVVTLVLVAYPLYALVLKQAWATSDLA